MTIVSYKIEFVRMMLFFFSTGIILRNTKLMIKVSSIAVGFQTKRFLDTGPVFHLTTMKPRKIMTWGCVKSYFVYMENYRAVVRSSKETKRKKMELRSIFKITTVGNRTFLSYFSMKIDCDFLVPSEDHCHRERNEQIDKKARKKLLIASILCVVFMIMEILGKY